MIFAASALRREDAAARLDRVRGFAGHGAPRVAWESGACIAVWPSEERATLDERARRAVAGPFDGDLRQGRAQGRFAAAQLEGGELTLARGRVGGRALYWAEDGAVRLASTRLPMLLRALDARARPDAMRLAEIAVGDFNGRPSATAFEGVHRLLSGEVLRFRPGGAPRASFLAPPAITAVRGRPDELARALRDEVIAAARRAIEGLGRVAVLAGGGVDSSALLAAVTALVRGGSAKEVVALSLHFGGPGDDRPYMDALAAELGIVPLRMAPRAFAPFVKRSLVVDGQPLASAMGGWEVGFLELAKERGADVLLGGRGGDELFDGDPRGLALRALGGDVVGAVREAADLRVPWESTRAQRVREFVVRPLAVHATPRPLRRWARQRRRSVPGWAGPVLRDVLRRPLPDPVSDFGPRNPGEFFARLSDSKLAVEISDAQCALEADVGLPTETPFLDERLIGFVAGLPAGALFRGGYLRGLFREAFAGLVPDRVRLRTDKADFEPALDEMHAAAGGRGALAELATVPALDALGVVRGPAFRAAFDAFVRGDVGYEGWHELWALLSLEAFAGQALAAGAAA